MSFHVTGDWKTNALMLRYLQSAEKLLRDHSIGQAIPVSAPMDGYAGIEDARPDEECTDLIG